MRNYKIMLALFAVLAVVFLYEVEELFRIGFTTGENFPAYSSYRSDPMGLRALYGALDQLRGVTVSRNVEPIMRIGTGSGKTLIMSGASMSDDPVEVLKAIDAFIATGGRMVITFFPVAREPIMHALDEEEKAEEKKKEKAKEKEKKIEDIKKAKKQIKDDEDQKGPGMVQYESIQKRWGFEIAFQPRASGENDSSDLSAHKQPGFNEFPNSLSWHSVTYFDKLNDSWHPIYKVKDNVVMMERRLGDGTIVLCSDSYLLSNEAMRNDRYPALLTWLIGSSSSVIFDETHLGIAENPGTMMLIKKYRLQWLLGSLLLVALLFVWKNATSLIPKHEGVSGDARSMATGKDSTAGLTNLLRRSIPESDIISVCFNEWQSSFAKKPAHKGDKISRAGEIVQREAASPRTKRDPIKAYQDIQVILSGRKSEEHGK